MNVSDVNIAIKSSDSEINISASEGFNKQMYLDAIEILNRKIEDLEEKKNRSLKSRCIANLSRWIFAPTSVGVFIFESVVDASDVGEAFNDRAVNLASTVLMVAMLVFAGMTVCSWHYFGNAKQEQQSILINLHQDRNYKRFRSAALNFFDNPNPILFKKVKKHYEKLPQAAQALHAKAMDQMKAQIAPFDEEVESLEVESSHSKPLEPLEPPHQETAAIQYENISIPERICHLLAQWPRLV